jgi:hypothetical protein
MLATQQRPFTASAVAPRRAQPLRHAAGVRARPASRAAIAPRAEISYVMVKPDGVQVRGGCMPGAGCRPGRAPCGCAHTGAGLRAITLPDSITLR